MNASAAKMTTDHEAIRAWAEERGAEPATFKVTSHGNAPGVLRIVLPTAGEESGLKRIGWDEFFAKFDHDNLAFIYPEEPGGAGRIVTRQTAEAATKG